MKNDISEKSYSLVEAVDDSKQAVYTVRIEHPLYKGVVVQYVKISLAVNDDGATAKLSFQYDIREFPDNLDKSTLEQSSEFHTFLGDLLTYIIQAAFDSGNYSIGDQKPSKTDPIDVESTAADDTSEAR
jgi:hypothetical protein